MSVQPRLPSGNLHFGPAEGGWVLGRSLDTLNANSLADLKLHVLDGLRRWNFEQGGRLWEPAAQVDGWAI